MRKLHGNTIPINKVVLDILLAVKEHAVFIRENTNLDLLSTTAVRTSKERHAIISCFTDLSALKVFSGIHVPSILHVLNLVAGVHAGVTVIIRIVSIGLCIVKFSASVVFVLVLVLVLISFTGLITAITPLLLLLLCIPYVSLEILFHAYNVFAKVFVAAITTSGAQAEDNKALDANNSANLLIIGQLIIEGSNKLALLELDRVASDIGDVFLLIKLTAQLGACSGLGPTDKLVHILCFGSILLRSLGWFEGIGRSGSGEKKSESKLGVHDCDICEKKCS
mmetsp:Transcript_25788/g.76149  ORF Transcript_25788/g.76149 Transcript_25788/m.76149 type:complete len:280 (+) Transcript_25788:619-1458(+)